VHLKITADLEIVSEGNTFKLNVTNAIAQSTTPQKTGCSPYLYCDYVWSLIVWNWALTEFPNYTEEIDDSTYNLLNLSRIPAGLTSEQILEAINSFPMTFSLAGGVNDDLVINVNFLRGTLANSTAFESIFPATITDKTFEHLGFNLSRGSLYDAFGTYNPSNRPFTTTGEKGNPAQIDFIIQSMKNYLGRTVSYYFHWGDIAIGQDSSTLLVNGNFDPADLTPEPGGPLDSKIAELYANGKWQKSTDILTALHQNEFDVVATVGTPGVIKDGTNSGTMAPDRSIRGKSGEQYYVDKSTYLYYLKIFAHAVVRKYKDQIGVWLIQPELNASKFAYWIGFGKKYGNCWDEEGNTSDKFQWQVWRTWVDAVRQEDPTAKVSTALHMLNMQYGLETFGPDCDIISVNVYPNEIFATPVMGFAVGELVWGVRRALKGMGWEHKPVWITETNYPGVIDNNAEEPPIGTTLENNLTWYSYGRQAKYMRDAIESAAENGAKGFFWWHFLDSDSAYHSFFPWTGYGSLIIGNSNPPQFKVPAVTAFQTKSSTKHFGKSNVTLTNKTASNPNLGGTIGLYAERDNLSSGTSVYINKNRSHVSQTYNPVISSQKHQSWGMPTALAAQFRLKEDFIPTDQTISRNAWFATTSSVTFNTACIDGGTVSASTLNYLDPWFVDGNGNQPNTSRTVSLSPTFSENIFLGINPNFFPDQPYYQLTAPATQSLTLNGQSVIVSFQYWSYTNATPQNANSATSGFVFNTGATATANYKCSSVSNSSSALSSNSQRKIVQDVDRNFHLVYESMNAVWYEKINENGTTIHVRKIADNAKDPSLCIKVDWGLTKILSIIFVKNDFGIQLVNYDARHDILYNAENVYSAVGYVDNDMDPIVVVPCDGEIVAMWKEPSNSPNEKGLYYINGIWTDHKDFQWYDEWYSTARLSGTTWRSKHPAWDVHVSTDYYTLNIAWEEKTATRFADIFFTTLTYDRYLGEFSQTGEIELSDIAGFEKNERPSVIVVNGGARVSWIGSEQDDNYTVVFRDPSYGAYWNFGDGVTSVSINKSISPLAYAIGWNGWYGHEYADNSHFYSIGSLNSYGNDLQLSNSYLKSSMRSVGYHTASAPYRFNFSDPIFGVPQKQDVKTVSNGRGGIIALEDAQFRFLFGDITIDGNPVQFVEMLDTLQFPTVTSINKYLETMPFRLNDNSSFLYSVQYWTIDSAIAAAKLGDSGFVKFRVELIDAYTHSTIGRFDECTFSISSISTLKNIGYSVITKGIGNRDVKLRLFVELNKDGKYSIVNKVSRGSILGKNENIRKVISFNGLEVVREYSLSQNYPNPFNPVTTISYALPQDGMVTLKIYDALGREVSTLVNEFKQTGRYTASLDASRLSSGVYIYKLTSGKYSATKKMMLVK